MDPIEVSASGVASHAATELVSLRRRLMWQAAAIAVLAQPIAAHALEQAFSSVEVECLVREADDKVGTAFADCARPEDRDFSKADATASTFFGERPGASAGLSRSNTPGHIRQQVSASARLTYEMRISTIAAPPQTLTAIPVQVSILGEVSRLESFDGNSVSPTATASASVYIRSDPNIPLVGADVLQESAIQGQVGSRPNFNKIVQLSLFPDHTYVIDVLASCRLNAGGFVKTQVASSGSCSAFADPAFTLDQATLDARLGPNTFSLASNYQFEFSPNVSAVPEPSAALMCLGGLPLLALLRWRSWRIAGRARRRGMAPASMR